MRQINNNAKVYPSDNSSGFVVFSEGDAVKKIEEQLGKAKVIDEDPTQKYTSKIQKHLCKLRKEKKFTERNILKYTLQIQFRHGYMEQLKLTNLKRSIRCVLLHQQLEHHLMEFLNIWLK